MKNVPQRLKAVSVSGIDGTAEQGRGRKDVPRGLKPSVFPILYGPTKEAAEKVEFREE
jgi:hypothetical protein